MNGAEEDDGVGYERQDHAAVFDLDMDYDDDEVLLDWEQYSGMGNAPSPYYVLGAFSIAKSHVYWKGLLRKKAMLHACRWQEVPVHGPGCDVAGQGMSLVPMLGAPRMVGHAEATIPLTLAC